MSNPVEPTSGAAQAFPPPNSGQGFPPPNSGQGFPPPNAGVPGAPGTEGFPPPIPDAPKKSAGKKVLSILGTILVVLVFVGLKFGLRTALADDPTADAKVGDCISVSDKVKDNETTETEADIVDCSSKEALFVVVGRVEGTSDVEGPACDKFFTENDKDPAALGSTKKDDYLLCIKAKG
ncbi:LppU/SCO3897 family protein [Actinoplanes regularis]|uniref:LppU/SCO3897 family protein n=1 Tax=Actinoplanes regularis TaxID=52697 RepID=UPI0024A3438D|nr:hypothetical protein [Actinoplanes regularis]GLW31419.1 hypothetical protein Areg01_43590 [Actinoplanes regularis]